MQLPSPKALNTVQSVFTMQRFKIIGVRASGTVRKDAIAAHETATTLH